MTPTLTWGYVSDVGMVRAINQDAAMANGNLFAVADGMGGHRGGEVASDIVAGHLMLREHADSADALSSLVVEANEMIRVRASLDSSLAGMGTTLVALAVVDRSDDSLQFAAANVGDSRIYRLDGDRFDQISEDHSLVGELVRSGQLRADEAIGHPQRNVVTRALGVDDSVDVDTWVFPAVVGQRYLLCSDGLIDEVADAVIEAALRSDHDAQTVARRLVEAAKRNGGRDNVTVLVVDVVEDASCEAAATES
ncbi:MAG: protein phosphatase 2C domain-containing protein [Acidimicrobiales bacterium]